MNKKSDGGGQVDPLVSSEKAIMKGILDSCGALAKTFYAMQGCQVANSFKFYEATHPTEVGCWNMAIAAYEHIDGTDVAAILDEFNDS